MKISEKISIVDAALTYLDNGFSVLPCRPNKKPTGSWGKYETEPMSNETAQQKFSNAWGIGIICGKVSGNLECIDFDKKVENIDEIYNKYINDPSVKNIISRNSIYTQRTQSGGYHFIYRYDTDKTVGNQSLAKTKDGKSAIIETRGEGGYFIAPPSPGYNTITGSLEKLNEITWDERQYLIEYAKSFCQYEGNTTERDGKQINFDETDPIHWFNHYKKEYAVNLLKDAGWVRDENKEGKPIFRNNEDIEYWTRPGKELSEGTSATWNYRHNQFFVWTNGGEDFMQEAYYTPFQILQILRFNRDFQAALNWVMKNYFPDQKTPERPAEPEKNGSSLLSVKTANQWITEAKERQQPDKLYDVFWYENEICILFADTNVGKSILAVQIADEISQHSKIIYADFELTGKQFEGRYSNNYESHYQFSDNLLRLEINSDANIDEKKPFEDQLIDALEYSVTVTGANIMIVDNITYIGTETEQSKNALPLMKKLKSLKKKHNLSMLLLAHTPKRNMSKPITRNDLAGSKALINFVDSSFTIGESFHDKRLRYLKQIKCRESEIKYDTNNVMLYEIQKENNFLKFDFVGYAKEAAHLKTLTDKAKEDLENNVLELHHEGKSYRTIGKETGISHTEAKRIIDKLKQTALDLKA